MDLFGRLKAQYSDINAPIIKSPVSSLTLAQINPREDLEAIPHGSVVALIGDFDAISVSAFLQLVERNCIVMPLVRDTHAFHDGYYEITGTEYIVDGTQVSVRSAAAYLTTNPLVDQLRQTKKPGLILFSSGTTGEPKAILHDFSAFLARYQTPRPPFRTLSFLMFDHIGGINTLLHALFNQGTIVQPPSRKVEDIVNVILEERVELLPTTPTFCRMLLWSGQVSRLEGSSLRLITYGTERMDPVTLRALHQALPDIDLRQTYGMSELGILRIKSRSKTSLFMRIGGEGIEIDVREGRLFIRAANRMLGYLNAPQPFDSDGWYDTGDLVECDKEFIKIVGRASDLVNVGGLKFTLAEVEDAAKRYPGADLAAVKALRKDNPITGHHVELIVDPGAQEFDCKQLSAFLRKELPKHMVPAKISCETIAHNHRFKVV